MKFFLTISFLLLSYYGQCSAIKIAAGTPSWPSLIFGDWIAQADATPLGPLLPDQYFSWHVRPLSNGGLLMWDNMTTNMITGSSQQFWALGSNLYYCGWIQNFFDADPVPIQRLYTLQSLASDSITWCDTATCSGLQWVLTVSQDSFQITVMLYPPIIHVSLTFKRTSSNSTVLPYNSTIPTCVPPSHAAPPPSGCPFKNLIPALPREPLKTAPHHHMENYDHCYQLNDFVKFRIYWTLSLPDKLSIGISVPATSPSSNWVAIGFGPIFPGMNLSDIALGYLTAEGIQCSRSMTAMNPFGPPSDSTTMQLLNPSITYSNGILTYEFTRTLTSGNNVIPLDPPALPGFSIIWATGPAPPSCTTTPSYHSFNRGYRPINFLYPSKVFDKFRICQQ